MNWWTQLLPYLFQNPWGQQQTPFGQTPPWSSLPVEPAPQIATQPQTSQPAQNTSDFPSPPRPAVQENPLLNYRSTIPTARPAAPQQLQPQLPEPTQPTKYTLEPSQQPYMLSHPFVFGTPTIATPPPPVQPAIPPAPVMPAPKPQTFSDLPGSSAFHF